MDYDVELKCEVYANPPARISWLKDGKDIVPSAFLHVVGGSNLKLFGLISSDGGMYQCIAENEVGTIQTVVQLVVLPPGLFFIFSSTANFCTAN